MALTDVKVRKAKAEEKQRKLFDGRGLHLVVKPNGSKLWRLKYRYEGREKTLSIGRYPEVSLADARDRAHDARVALAAGTDPSGARQEQKRERQVAAEGTVEAVVRDWLARIGPSWAPKTLKRVTSNMEQDVLPWIGHRPMIEVEAPELLRVLRRIEDRGAVDMAHRTRQRLSQLFRFAIAAGKADRDPAADLRGALGKHVSRNFAAVLDPREVGQLLRALDGYEGQFVTRCALRMAPHVFARPGELRAAEWAEVDLKARRWTIPAARMKAGRDHIVPLSGQVVAILEELHPLTGRGRYLFPGLRTTERPMSENTVNAALRRLGYAQDQMTGHGFRAIASTHLHEQGWSPEAIERQLAHVEQSRVKAAYHRGEHLAERVKMMQAWSDYLDGLRGGADVVPIGEAIQSG